MSITSGGAHAAHQSQSHKSKSLHAAADTAKSSQEVRYTGLRGTVQNLIEAAWFRNFIMAIIIANAVVLGLDTVKVIANYAGGLPGRTFKVLDIAFLAIFVIEILLKLFVQRLRFFRDGWNLFDFFVVGIALVPASESLSALRTIRVVRALRLLSMIPSMRAVVGGLVHALPGMFSAMLLLGLIHYVYAVIGVNLYGGHLYGGYGDGYDYFQDLGRATYTLFQIMTLESWSHGIVRPILEVHPGPGTSLYFVSYVILSAFAALNLFIGIIVNAMDTLKQEEESAQTAEEMADPAQLAILAELRALRQEIADLKK